MRHRAGLESMVMLVRQVAAILALPCTVAIVIPIWIARRNHVIFTAPHSATAVLAVLGGTALVVIGLALF